MESDVKGLGNHQEGLTQTPGACGVTLGLLACEAEGSILDQGTSAEC